MLQQTGLLISCLWYNLKSKGDEGEAACIHYPYGREKHLQIQSLGQKN